jgi:hypothetical protein
LKLARRLPQGVVCKVAVRRLTEGGKHDASYLSAQKKAPKKGTRFPQENGDCQWPQGACSQESKRKKASHLLKRATNEWLFLIFCFLEK